MKTTIITPTPNLSSSLEFYRKLNFSVLSKELPTVVTDGQAIIEINPDRFARSGIKLSGFDLSTIHDIEGIFDFQNGKTIRDPNGVWIYLTDRSYELDFDKSTLCFGHTGNFSGISIETDSISNSVKFWQRFGFIKHGGNEEHGYLTLINENNFQVSFMRPFVCPHLFFNPSMNYFNHGENLQNIQKIKDAGIEITEAITVFNPQGIADNIIIRDPGGYGFFVFND